MILSFESQQNTTRRSAWRPGAGYRRQPVISGHRPPGTDRECCCQNAVAVTRKEASNPSKYAHILLPDKSTIILCIIKLNWLYQNHNLVDLSHHDSEAPVASEIVRGLGRVLVSQESGIRNQEIFIFNTTKAFGQVNSTCLQKSILHIQGIKAIYHDNQVEEKQNKTKYT